MPTLTTKTGRHAAPWTFESTIIDQCGPFPGTGQHRGNLIDAFRKHLTRRFGNR